MLYIIDCIIRIKNAYSASSLSATVKKSKYVGEFLNLLKQEGYIVDYKEEANYNYIVELKKTNPIKYLNFISKPGRILYSRAKKILFHKKNQFGVLFISTSQGLLPHYKCIEKGIGGQLLLELY